MHKACVASDLARRDSGFFRLHLARWLALMMEAVNDAVDLPCVGGAHDALQERVALGLVVGKVAVKEVRALGRPASKNHARDADAHVRKSAEC